MGIRRILVVGDLHGCADELERLLDFLSPGEDDTLCFLGDYIDRGPASKRVVETLLRLREKGPHCIFLRGNHEDMFLAYLGLPGRYGNAFLLNGGGRTLASYGIPGASGRKAKEVLPPEHLEFFLNLEYQAAFDRFLCIHAGLRPGVPLDRQNNEDRIWIRKEFTSSTHDFPFTVVFGHTPYKQVLLDPPYKIGIDTGLVYGNLLSCLELRSMELFQIRRNGERVTKTNLQNAFGNPGT